MKPLVSSRADDPDAEDAIEKFVVTLGERIDALQDSEAGGDLSELAERAGALATMASDLGYEPLAQVALALAYACQSTDAQAAHKHTVEATELAARIRRGHHTSA